MADNWWEAPIAAPQGGSAAPASNWWEVPSGPAPIAPAQAYSPSTDPINIELQQQAQQKTAAFQQQQIKEMNAPKPKAPPVSFGDVLNKTLATVGSTITGAFKPATPVNPAKPPSLIDSISGAARSLAVTGMTNPSALPTAAALKTPGVKNVITDEAKGIGSIAIQLLGGYDDILGLHHTASDDTEHQLSQQLSADAASKGVTTQQAAKDFTNSPAGKSALTQAKAVDLGDALASGLVARLFSGRIAATGEGATAGAGNLLTPTLKAGTTGAKLLKTAQVGGLGMFGANLVKETPSYIQQIAQAPDPNTKFQLSTQLLGSYLLLGHAGATEMARLPTTKTIKGEEITVPVKPQDANEYMNNPNPNLTPHQIEAFNNLYSQGGHAVAQAVKAGQTTIKAPDLTVPNVYGQLINMVRAKIGRQEPLTPSEQAVQAAVVTSPETLVPKPSDIIKDPASLQTITKMQAESITPPAPVSPGVVQLSSFKNPGLGIQQAPSRVITPAAAQAPPPPAAGAPAPAPATAAPAAPRAQPTASLSRVEDIARLAAQAPTSQAFIANAAQINPDSLRGYKQTDGSIVNGKGTQPGTVSVADPSTKTITDRPAAQVLTDFYHQLRGEPVPTAAQSPGAPEAAQAPKTLKGVIKTKEDAQAAVAARQRATSGPAAPVTTKTPRSLKKRPATQPAARTGQARLDELALQHANELRAMHKELGGVTTMHIEGNGAEGDTHTRHSLNSLFYRRFYQEHGKPPTKQDWLDHAHEQLRTGRAKGQTDEKSIAEYQKIHKELNPPSTYAEHERSVRELVGSVKFKNKGHEDPANLHTVKEGASYLQRARGSAPFEFTTKPLDGGAAATFQPTTKMVSAALTPDSKINIMHVGHEVGHEIFTTLLTEAERTEFAAIVRAEYEGTPEELAHKIVAYNYFDLPEEHQGIIMHSLNIVQSGDPTMLGAPQSKVAEYTRIEAAYHRYTQLVAEDGADRVKYAILAQDVSGGRALLKFFNDAHDQVTNRTYSDTVMEEIFSDMNGEYVADRTGKWSDQLKTWFADLWNGIKKMFGADYDKMREVFKRSYDGQYRDTVANPKPEGALVRAKAMLEDDPELWEQRFAEAASQVSKEVDEYSRAEREIFGAQRAAADRVPPALGSIPLGETRELFDPESTPGMDHEHIIKANPSTSPRAVVENYDGLLELRKLKAEERLAEIFKGIGKDESKQLFEAAKAYQVGGVEGANKELSPELAVVFNKVTRLYEAVAQDAYASGRIRGVRENYITQIWDKDSINIPETSLTPEQVNFLRNASSTTTRFGLEKIVKSYNDGIAVGLKPKYDNLKDLLREYLLADARAAVGQYFASDMLALGDDHILATANGLPAGWKAINKISGLRGYSVSPEAWKAIKGIESISAIREHWFGRAAVKTAQVSTQIIMAGDFLLLKNYFFDSAKASTFGAVRLLIENAGMTPQIRTNLVAYGGLKLSEHGTPEMRGGKLGKVLSKVMDEKKNPYFWADLASFRGGDMLRNGTATMIYKERIKAGDTPAVAAKKAVKFAQDTFGRQNLIRAGRSQTTQDILRTLMISPDYTESRFRFMGRAFAGATYKIKDREYRRNTTGFLRYLFYAGLLLEAVNLAASGHTTDKNDPDHRWDVEMHNADGTKYYVNLLGVVKTDLRFITGLRDAGTGDFQTLTQFIGNKGSSIERVVQMLVTGKDYRGNDIVNAYTDSALQKWEKMSVAAVNNFVPLPVQGFTTPAAQSGPAPKGVTGYVLRTLGFDLTNPKAVPTEARQSLVELQNAKQQVQLDVYSLIRQGKVSQAQHEIDAFNKKAGQVGQNLSTLQNITPTDKQSLLELGSTAAIDSVKLIASAQAAKDGGASPDPISKLIDYGVGGTTVSSSSSSTGQATAKANAVKAAATRKARSAGTVKSPKSRSSGTRKPRSLKRKGSGLKKLKSLKRRKI